MAGTRILIWMHGGAMEDMVRHLTFLFTQQMINSQYIG